MNSDKVYVFVLCEKNIPQISWSFIFQLAVLQGAVVQQFKNFFMNGTVLDNQEHIANEQEHLYPNPPRIFTKALQK